MTSHVARFKTREPLVRALNNALLFAGNDFTLPMLASVRFEFEATELRLVATDRYRLSVETIGAAHEPHEDVEIESTGADFLLPRGDAAALLKVLKGVHRAEPIELHYDAAADRVKLQTLSTYSEYRTDTEHTFPAWRSLVPDLSNAKPADLIAFSPKFLGDFGKVLTPTKDPVKFTLFGASKPTLAEFLGSSLQVLIMPVKLPG